MPEATPNPYAASTFGGIRQYLLNKRAKLQLEDEKIRQQAGGVPQIFKGLTISVNGYTKPTAGELRALIVKHGGIFKQYLDAKTAVTHIVALSLTPAKQVEFAQYKVVKPSWITESIEAGALLPWHRFSVIEGDPSQLQLGFGDTRQLVSPAAKLNPYKPAEEVKSKRGHANGTVNPSSMDMSKQISEPLQLVENASTAEHHNAALLSDPRVRKSSVLNPEFLQSYYKSSRLHHLSTWKSDLRAKIQENVQRHATSRSSESYVRNYIFHVDFDCFFAAFATRDRPDLKSMPVCVSHGMSDHSEIASCNYKAREAGVKNGMWMINAKQLCPDLMSFPYNFPAYEEVSQQFYDILLSLDADSIQPVSIDEALLDLSSSCSKYETIEQEEKAADDLATLIRDRVRSDTGCDVSVGIGNNILLAKIALRKAKPAGQYRIRPFDALKVLEDINISSLPSVGHSTVAKLQSLGIETVLELRECSKDRLQSNFGKKIGERLYDYARGKDDKKVGDIKDRKSVSAEVNWGVRFENKEQVDEFIYNLSTELANRLAKQHVRGSLLTLKVHKRAADAPYETVKFMGCGKCEVFSKSISLHTASRDKNALSRHAQSLLRSLQIPHSELRGLGLQMTKLCKSEKPGDLTLQTLGSGSAITEAGDQNDDEAVPAHSSQYEIPSQIDPDVLNALPKDMRNKILAQSPQKSAATPSRENFTIPTGSNPISVLEKDKNVLDLKDWVIKSSKTQSSPTKASNGLFNAKGKKRVGNVEACFIDPQFLAALPEDIRKELLSTTLPGNKRKKSINYSSRKELYMDRTHIPTFQRLSKMEDIQDLLGTWYNGFYPHPPMVEDVDAFATYLAHVVLMELNLQKAACLLKWFAYLVREADPGLGWQEAISTLVQRVNSACRERGIGKLDFERI